MTRGKPERARDASAAGASSGNSVGADAVSSDRRRHAIEANEVALRGTPSSEYATRAPYSTADNELISRTWASRYIRVATMLLVFFLAIYLAVDMPRIDSWRSATLWLHLAAIVSGAVFFSLIGTAWFDRNWHWLTIALCAAVFAATAEVGLINSTSEPIFIMVMLVVLGAAALMPWNAGWQAVLTLCGLLAVMADSMWGSPAEVDLICRWTALFAMAGVAHFSSSLGERYRVELSARMNALSASHERLLAEVAKRKVLDGEHEGARKRIAQSETKLRKIFDASLDAVAITRLADGVYIDVNRAFEEITGYSKAEVAGVTVAALNVWVNIDERRKFARQLRQSGARRNEEVILRDRYGTARPFLLSASIVELDGEPCVVSISRDIARRKKIEAELIAAREAALAASEAKSEFLSSMSHEIRTPMNAILGMADLLWDSPLGFEQRRYLNTMRTNGNALLDLIDGILDLAKVESGRLNLESTPFELDDLADKSLETLGIRAHEKGLELAGRIMAGVPLNLLGDPLRLRQIIINLVGNAIKFTARGEIVLTVEPLAPAAHGNDAAALRNSIAAAPALLRFSISDTGIGIAPDQIATIFSSFTQADSSMARKYGGSGLGLSIVKRLVELMNGEITVESQAGRGSTFSFTVPLGVQPPRARFASATDILDSRDGAGAPALKGLRVLVADDTAINRLIVRDVLTHAGVEITEVEDGGQALAAFEHAEAAGDPYALVVLDGRMPGTDGIEVARRILSRPRPDRADKHPAILLMLTSDSLNPMRTQLDYLGLDPAGRCRYIVKPLKRAELIAAIAILFAPAAPAEDAAAPLTAPYRNGRANADDGANLGGGSENRTAPLNAATGAIGATAATAPPLHILLAEDSPDNRLLIDAYLKNTPYQLDFAENGQVAIDRFKTEKYDLVLMDIQMPVVDGYTAVKAIRAWEREGGLKPTPIIALTASALEEAVRKSLAVGCTAHVAKPVRRATLIEAIKNAAAVSAAPPHAPAGATAPVIEEGRVTKKIVVRADPDLSDLIPGFLEHKRADAKLLEAAIERADHETLSRLGHKMKGEGGSYGLNAISEIGGAIEQAAKAGDLAAIRLLAADLGAYLKAVEVVFD